VERKEEKRGQRIEGKGREEREGKAGEGSGGEERGMEGR